MCYQGAMLIQIGCGLIDLIMDYILEVCVDNEQAIRNAVDGGAHRIELCSCLELDGLTPDPGLMRKAKEICDIPVFCMIRPKNENYFYNDTEVRIMRHDIIEALDIGIDGFVFGALSYNKDLRQHEINKAACRTLLSATGNKPVTFHRAFDLVEGTSNALSEVIRLGFHRILTSGGALTASRGRINIKSLFEQAGEQIIVMPGGGINETNLEEIVNATGAKEIHTSARYRNDAEKEAVAEKKTGYQYFASTEIVRRMVEILRTL